jgi:hypothetical protein
MLYDAYFKTSRHKSIMVLPSLDRKYNHLVNVPEKQSVNFTKNKSNMMND